MKKHYSSVIALAIAAACTNATAADLINNDFSDGTTQGWAKGGSAATPIKVGTEADGNKYIKLISFGKVDPKNPDATGPDTKMTVNSSVGWRGNFSGKGAKSVSVRFKNMGQTPLHMHLAFKNEMFDLSTRWVVKQEALVPTDKQWHDYKFSLADADLQMIPLGGHGRSNATFSAKESLGSVNQVRFSNATLGQNTGNGHGDGLYSGWNEGEETVGELWIDDIKLSTDAVVK